jgi:O-ureido-D-serine cyclo-ligase
LSPRIATRIALVSAREALALDEDMPPLVAALRAAGVQVGTPAWDDPDEDWVGFDAAVLRSTWDYVERIEEFLAWAEHCAARTLLLNPPEVVRWNTDKHYLRQLAEAGVPVVPTRFVEPGTDVRAALREFLMRGTVDAGQRGEFAEFVVKPSIGAGSRDTARYGRDDTARAIAHIERLLAAGRSTILQPYLDRVDQAGETALIHFGGQFSHAIRKGPLLRAGAGLVDGLFAPEEITAREPDDAERRVAAAVCAAMPFEPLLYARVDLIRDPAGAPVLLELELTEPSLFLAHAPGAAERLVQALLSTLDAPR